jgi:type IV pilus assembly protein PilA
MDSRQVRGGGAAGFTLVELMVVVAIIGVLAAVAVPSFMRYITKAKTAEVEQNIEKLSTGARAYFLDSQVAKNIGGATIGQRFPASTALSPAISCCDGGADRCLPRDSYWADPTWRALTFSVDDPHYYRYEFESANSGVDAEFTARAYGDLDCDNLLSTFERYGWVQILGNDMTIQSGTYKENRLE